MSFRGLPWVPALPSHWTLTRGREIAFPVKRSPQNNAGVVTAFRDGQVTLRSNRRTDGFTESIKEIGYQGVAAGELVIHSMDGFAGAIGVSDSGGKMSPVVHIYTVPNDNPFYIAHTLRVAASLGYIQSLAKGIRERSTSFDKSTFLSMPLPRPPRTEQDLIADYLDRETARIDTLIEEQQRLIELLRERRQVLVDRTVFGIDHPNDRTVSFINRHLAVEPLLTRLPSHWKIKRFKVVLSRRDERNLELTAPMMSLKSTGEVAPRGADQQQPDSVNLPRYLIARPEELVVNPMWLTGGAVGVSEVFGAVSPDYRVFRSLGDHHPRYLHHLLRSSMYRDQYVLYTRAQTTFDRRVQQPDLDNMPLPIPPLDEQRQIAAQIDDQTAKIDQLIAETEKFIELSRERRSALITAAVTGQIDVTEAA